MAARKHTGIFRSPRTHHQKKWNEAYCPYVRVKRRPSQFREWYREPHVSVPGRNWKAQFKKRRQWMKGALKPWWRQELADGLWCQGLYRGYILWSEDLPGGMERLLIRHVGKKRPVCVWEGDCWGAEREAKALIDDMQGALYLHDKRKIFADWSCRQL